MVVVQLWGVDIFDLPQALTIANPPKDQKGNPIVAIGTMVASREKSDPERWTAATIIPYTAPYPHIPPRAAHDDDRTRTISVLLRERVSSGEDVINHEEIQLAENPDLLKHYSMIINGPPPISTPLPLLVSTTLPCLLWTAFIHSSNFATTFRDHDCTIGLHIISFYCTPLLVSLMTLILSDYSLGQHRNRDSTYPSLPLSRTPSDLYIQPLRLDKPCTHIVDIRIP